jgi:hypothetical protein
MRLGRDGEFLMHIIRVEPEKQYQFRFHCSCGTTGNAYGTATLAYQTGLAHKEAMDGDTNEGHADIGEPVSEVKERKRKKK